MFGQSGRAEGRARMEGGGGSTRKRESIERRLDTLPPHSPFPNLHREGSLFRVPHGQQPAWAE